MFLKFIFASYFQWKKTDLQIVTSRNVIKTKCKYNEQAELAKQVVRRSDLDMSQPPNAN